MVRSTIRGDRYYPDSVVFGTKPTVPAGSFGNDDIEDATGIDSDKLEHRHGLNYKQDDGSDVVAAIVPIYLVKGATATIKSIQVASVDAPEGGDKAFTVDLKKANEGTPTPASVLSSVITIDSTVSDCEVKAGTISSASLVAGDTLLAVIAVSGSTGNQGQGVIVTVTIDEDAN